MLVMRSSYLSQIEERANAATFGPWDVESGNTPLGDTGEYMGYCTVKAARKDVAYLANPDEPQAEANSKFIAHAREDIVALVREVRRLQEQLGVRSS